jgi:hypothetical protein
MDDEIKKLENQVKYLKISNKHFKNKYSAMYDKNAKIEQKVHWLNVVLIIESSIILSFITAALTMILLRK